MGRIIGHFDENKIGNQKLKAYQRSKRSRRSHHLSARQCMFTVVYCSWQTFDLYRKHLVIKTCGSKTQLSTLYSGLNDATTSLANYDLTAICTWILHCSFFTVLPLNEVPLSLETQHNIEKLMFKTSYPKTFFF